MLYVYGSVPPMRTLEEIIFWKRREKEHAELLIRHIPALEPPYVNLLGEWARVFEATEGAARSLLEEVSASDRSARDGADRTGTLLSAARAQSQAFIRQLGALAEQSAAVQALPAGQDLLRQPIRESENYPAALPQDEPVREKTEKSVPIGGHTLPPLPYAYNALEPHIDEKTMRIHHDIHHQSYVDGLNKAEKKLANARRSGDFELVKHWERELAFNGAGHYLHTIFWDEMSPKGGGQPTGPLLQAIERDFGSYDAFKKQFSQAAEKVEGSGWAILVWSPRSRRLEILTAEKHQNLSQWDAVPLLALDVWEHAYYLKHQNKRADYIKDWWNVVNWPYVSERFEAASRLKWQPF
ncbi:DUF2935 domain-containing protein [Paenibacillus spiritus]|uniref:superoxide dismutase n=1 Tax=Paenibacillus spiritus TaxID=2496557 RepID=A0A5J5FU10_9BACL|nr:Fe-Mn family superoxide dismutase [Paenibacillus spiritus]KAA8997154.1 DUF2935 domain-containing protein [Paenibacillus spiritus]